MQKKSKSIERKQYLRKRTITKVSILITQITIVILFIALWEMLANKGIIDSFITSQPSRMLKTFMNLSSNGLLKHLGVTCYETIVGFLSGAFLGVVIAIILWWSKFLSKVSEPFLVVLNSLPKIALRTSYNNMGRCRNICNNSNGTCNCIGNLMTTNAGKPAETSNTIKKLVSYDGQEVANLFSKIKRNNKINECIKLTVNRIPMNMPKPELKDFADQMIYFRKQLGYSQKQVANEIGVSEDTYRRYELKEVKLVNIKKIDKIVKFLKFTEEPKVSEYVKFLMSNPEKMLIKFFKQSGISKNEFAKKAGFNRRSILEWINKKKSISEESYYKIKKFLKEYEKKTKTN